MAKLLTIPEVCAWLQVSDDVVRKLIKGGDIVASKVAGQWRIEEQAVRDYLNATSNRPQPQAVAT